MSVIVKGMEMPTDCRKCILYEHQKYTGLPFCKAVDKRLADDYKPRSYDERPDWCPLVELPERHGRLIDKDRLKREMLWNFAGEKIPLYDCDNNPVDFHVKDVEATINSQPTVIEAESEE